MWKPLLLALLAACGNALFVYGQRGSPQAGNPFLFTAGAVGVCLALFLAAVLVYRTPGDAAYLATNGLNIALSGIGFFFTFVGFFLLYSNYGASQYVLYALLSIVTTAFGVGVLVYREPLNLYQLAAVGLAMAAIALWSYGKSVS